VLREITTTTIARKHKKTNINAGLTLRV